MKTGQSPPHTYTPPETVFFDTLAGVYKVSDKSPPMAPFKVHIVGRTGVDSYLVLVVSGYGTLGPELIYLVSSCVCVDLFCCLEF